MPARLRGALWMVAFQAGATLLFAVSMSAEIDEGEARGLVLEHAETWRTGITVSYLLGVALIVCGVEAARRRTWAWNAVVPLEVVYGVFTLICAIATGTVITVVGTVLAILVVRRASSGEGRVWLDTLHSSTGS